MHLKKDLYEMATTIFFQLLSFPCRRESLWRIVGDPRLVPTIGTRWISKPDPLMRGWYFLWGWHTQGYLWKLKKKDKSFFFLFQVIHPSHPRLKPYMSCNIQLPRIPPSRELCKTRYLPTHWMFDFSNLLFIQLQYLFGTSIPLGKKFLDFIFGDKFLHLFTGPYFHFPKVIHPSHPCLKTCEY